MNTKLSFLLICLFILVCIAGCRKNTSPPSAPSSSSAPSSAPIQPVQPEGGNTTLAEVKYFKGSIGDSLDLQMKLFRTGEQLTGNYYYQKIGTRIDLRGTVDKENNVTLEEFDGGGKQTGMF